MRTDIKEVLLSIDKNTWIISDTHLGHKSILEYEGCRKIAMKEDGFENHEDWVINNWNKTVKEEDTALCLGDFAFNGVADYIEKLNGNIIFIMGNHDSAPRGSKWEKATVIRGVFINDGRYVSRLQDKKFTDDVLLSALIMDLNGKRYLFSHYALFNIDDWDRKNKKIAPRIKYLEQLYNHYKCDYNVHGHLHSENSTFENSINVSFEHLDFKPQKLKNILG